MENSSVEENVKLLMNELSKLMRISPEGWKVENDSWSKIVKSLELEVHNTCNKFFELRNGLNPKQRMAEDKLNTEVKHVVKYLLCLQECVNIQQLQGPDRPKMYSCGEVERFTNGFSIPMGAGSFAKVYKGEFPDGTKIAVKVLEEKDVLDMFLAELSTMGRTSHQYLVKLYGYCFDKKIKALVYEYMENGSLDEILYGNPHGLDWKKFYEIAIKIAEGLSFLHHDCPKTIIHHDIKPANVLIDLNLSPKITDFGLAKFMNQCLTHRTNTGLRGTTCFVAPEVIYPGFEVNEKCDVYSFGMVLFEILLMKRLELNKGWFPVEVYTKFKAGELDQVFESCSISHENSEDAKILSVVALWCVQFKHTSRPSMSKVVKMLRRQITILSPPDPFPHFTESSVPIIQEEIYPKPSQFAESSRPTNTIKEDVYPKYSISPSNERDPYDQENGFLIKKSKDDFSVKLLRILAGDLFTVRGNNDNGKCSLLKVEGIIELFAENGEGVLNFGGKLVDQIECPPASIGKLSGITELNLSNNRLRTLPDAIGNMKALTEFDAHNNQLINLPEAFGELVNLIDADLCNNRLKSLPASFEKLGNLANLDLSSNTLAALPETMGSLKSLRILNVERNELKELPDSIVSCSVLEELKLNFNQLKALPEETGNIETLRVLSLRCNGIQGLPTTIGNLLNLQELDVSVNKLESVPDELCFATSLVKLNVSCNFAYLKALPHSIGDLKLLEELDIRCNQIRSLPESLRFLSNLEKFTADETPLELPPKKVINLGAQEVVQYMANYVAMKDVKVKPSQLRLEELGTGGGPKQWLLEKNFLV